MHNAAANEETSSFHYLRAIEIRDKAKAGHNVAPKTGADVGPIHREDVPKKQRSG